MDPEILTDTIIARCSNRYQQVVRVFESFIVTALQVLLILTVTIATVILFALFVSGLRTQVTRIDSLGNLMPVIYKAFSGVLIILLGLELMETLASYFIEYHVKVEVILVVAMIAAGRDIIEIDFAHTPALQLLGYGGLILSLAVGYFVVKKAHALLPPK
jgi:uncharacterized membrane protein (DUF373 family)